MIMLMLQPDPSQRPNIKQLEVNNFFYCGYTPTSLPLSCLTMAPRFDQLEKTARPPLILINSTISCSSFYKYTITKHAYYR